MVVDASGRIGESRQWQGVRQIGLGISITVFSSLANAGAIHFSPWGS